MNVVPDTQLAAAVNNELASMQLPATNQVVTYIMNSIAPYINNMAAQANFAYNAYESMVHSLMMQNQQQIMEIARLRQTHQEMPRMFCTNPANGFGFCMDNGKEKIIGKLRITHIYNCIIDKNKCSDELLYIAYYDADEQLHHTIVPYDKLAGKNLLPLFKYFRYICRSKELANDYLANCINNFPKKDNFYFPEYCGFSFFTGSDGKEAARFDCNNNIIEMQLLKECSPYYVQKILPHVYSSNLGTREICEKYLGTNESMFMFVYSVSGLLSSFFREIDSCMERILAISIPNSAVKKKAGMIMQIFNRGSKPLSFDSNKNDISKAIIHSKDETVIIGDCSLIDNDKRRTEMLRHITVTDNSNECQPHNIAIISVHAQYMLPPEKKICLTLPDDFSKSMTKAYETEMCNDLNYLINVITKYICRNYSEFKKGFTDVLSIITEQYKPHFENYETARVGGLLSTVYTCVVERILGLNKPKEEKLHPYILSVLSDSQCQSETSADAVAEQFIESLNNAVRNGKLEIIMHSKKMNFVEGTNQLIVKDDLLIMEESALENIIIPHMRTTDNVCRTLKCLDECGYLHATKKNRYPVVVYSDNKSSRKDLIAVKREDILDTDVDLMIQESRYYEWYLKKSPGKNHIPISTNSIGETSYQFFDFEHKNNMHFFAIGNSNSGKTHCLTERMVSLHKLGYSVIVFDTSDSFTESEILEKLSVGGDESVYEEVREYVSENITFHNIEKDGIPVNILDLDYSENTEQKIREIQSVVESHNSNMGVRQRAAVYNAISQIVRRNSIDMVSLYKALTSEDIPYNLTEQLMDTLSFFVNFRLSDSSWGKFIDESKGIMVISTSAVSSSGGSGLIDMLLMSLFCHQRTHKDKHLSIFIDEIKTQNLSAKGPIAKILTEGRKYRMGLNFATQFPPKSEEVKMIMGNAGTRVFMRLDDRAAVMAAKELQIQPDELFFLEQGECYIKGTFYNQKCKREVPGIIRGRTYRNFLKNSQMKEES